MLGRKPITLLK